ncbi:hypothetical protein F4V45_02485 [Helicobacter canis]|uniref:Uncharacterized protein n=1 Tax=Helicobacter canis TaxID=29419 RepID=A0A5M9QRX6_9HELI|nr:hypothetical protein [Helicobacter canis]KAA8710799.1 hypothetical protein F4V45_02485 [Helicobacter canis]
MDCVVGMVAAVKRGGGKLARVSFPAKNGDRCGDSALITTQGKSLESPCEAPFLARKSFREQLQVKFSFSQNAVFSAKILESHIALESSLPSLRDTAEAVAWQSTHNAQKSKKVDSSMDCRADFQSARNDRKNAPNVSDSQAVGFCVFYPNAASKKVDSRSEAQNLKTLAKDSRILEIESGFCERVQGRILGVCNRRTREAIHDSSPKAESFNKPQRLAL